jgi:hypothetical protein
MGVTTTIRGVISAFIEPPAAPQERVNGAYWCHDCQSRITADEAVEEPPDCSACGEPMEFERSIAAANCPCC